MDFIVRLSDEISDFNNPVEVIQVNSPIKSPKQTLAEMINPGNCLVEGVYKVTLQKFIDTLLNATEETERVETPLLPQNCIKHVKVGKAAACQEVYIEVPKANWDIIYHKQEFNQVGFPRMIFKYIIKGISVKLDRIVAVKEGGRIKADTPLFHFPFAHVNSSGMVCMGTNRFPDITSIQQLEGFHSLFIGSPFQDDYGTRTSTKKSQREMFTDLRNKSFPDEWLLPINKTFNENFHFEN